MAYALVSLVYVAMGARSGAVIHLHRAQDVLKVATHVGLLSLVVAVHLLQNASLHVTVNVIKVVCVCVLR